MTTLGGCSGIGRALGVGKRPPDEFTVVGRAPLVVPPDFNLMPPKNAKQGEARKSDVDPHKLAMDALFPAGRTDLPVVMPDSADDAVSGGAAAGSTSSPAPNAAPSPSPTPGLTLKPAPASKAGGLTLRPAPSSNAMPEQK